MPKIPQYDQQVTAQAPSTQGVDQSLYTGGWKSATEMFGTLDKVVGEFKKVRDFNEVSSAELKINQDLGALKSKADKEQDPTKLAEYQSQIDDVINKHSSGISDNLIRTEAQSKFNLRGYSAFSDITSTLRNKEIEIGKSNLLLSLDGYEKSYASNLGDVKRKEDMAGAKGAIELASKNGIIGPDDATKMTLEVGKNFDKAALAYDIQHLPENVEALRAKGEYASLSDAEFDSVKNLAVENSKKLAKEAEIANTKAMISVEAFYSEQLASGKEINISDIQKDIAAGVIRQEFGQALIEYATSPRAPEVDKPDQQFFVDSLKGVFEAQDKVSAHNTLIRTLSGGKDGKLSQEDLGLIVYAAGERGKALRITTNGSVKAALSAGLYGGDSEQKNIDAGFKQITDWMEKSGIENTISYRNYLTSIKNNVPVKDAVSAAIRDTIIAEHPEVASMDGVPQMVNDKSDMKFINFSGSAKISSHRVYKNAASNESK